MIGRRHSVVSPNLAVAPRGGGARRRSCAFAGDRSFWSLYRRHFGPKGDKLILVAQAAIQVMNAILPRWGSRSI